MQPHRVRTADAAIGRWPGILKTLGVGEQFLQKKHGPCPICGGIDRFRMDDKEGRGTWFCSHCGAGDGFKLLELMFGWGFVQSAKEIDRVIGTVQAGQIARERTEADKLAAIDKALKESRKVQRGDVVWTYLNRRTGCECIPVDIRLHPGMRHASGGVFPVMLSVMRDIDGKGVTLHRTYLTSDGRKAQVDPAKKFMQGKKLNGACVRLSAIKPHIGIAEGIETALAAGNVYSMPVWAATNAVLLEQWAPPAGIERVSIFGDNDSSFTGQDAAYGLARRLKSIGIAVDVILPKEMDSDFADEYASLAAISA